MIGRYYAMDRDNRWDRVQQAYDLMTQGKGEFTADNATDALARLCPRRERRVRQATRIGDAAPMEDGDALIFMNFRADRAREITRAFVDTDFTGFARTATPALNFVMLTEYAADIKTAQPTRPPPWSTPWVSGWPTGQDPAAHLRDREVRPRHLLLQRWRRGLLHRRRSRIVASPKVATYDLQPEMSSEELTDAGRRPSRAASTTSSSATTRTATWSVTPACSMRGQSLEAVDHCIGRVTDARRKWAASA